MVGRRPPLPSWWPSVVPNSCGAITQRPIVATAQPSGPVHLYGVRRTSVLAQFFGSNLVARFGVREAERSYHLLIPPASSVSVVAQNPVSDDRVCAVALPFFQ